MIDRRWLSWLVAGVMSAGLSGCVAGAGGGPSDNRPPGGQIGGVLEGCDEEAEDIDADDISPLGFSARDVASAVAGERTVPLRWERRDTGTPATLSVGELVAARLVRSTAPDRGGSSGAEPLLADHCSDYVQVDVPLAFSTEDGVFDESFTVKLRARKADTAHFVHWVDPSTLQGSYEVTEVEPAEFREVNIYLSVELSTGAVEGRIGGRAKGYPIGGRQEDSVFEKSFDVAEF